MLSASFRFGSSAQHQVEIQCGYFGSEKYFVDGELVHSRWSLQRSGVRRFEAHGHSIEIRTTINLRDVRAEALVDDRLVAEDLFAAFNARIAQRRSGKPKLVRVLVWWLVAVAVLTTLQVIERLHEQSFERTPDGAARVKR